MEYIKRKTSDHSPMVIRLTHVNTRYEPSPFRFQKMWCSHGSFQRLVEETWKQPTLGSGMVKLAAKLKRLKMELRIWNKSVFGRVDTNIQELEARMAVLEAQLQSGFSEKIEANYIVTKLEIDIWEKREESRLAQLAKNKWLKEGDQNPKFFHAVVSQCRRGSVISQMRLADGTMLDLAKKVHLGAVDYFTNFLTDMPQTEHANLSPLVGLEISEEDNSSLCHSPSEEEVKEAVFSIPEHSSPGPDGYGSSFYISCCHIVKEEVVEAARDFFAGK
ncbi:hypothetical protein F2P56_024330 [Juglans regia]|uniref:Uncharacterized protein LOC108995797 n=2 Tax=Juglans regia TaxID=51240 RepID=A0A2I4F5N8_JUGRE|nr:uncharacterized protein LOC108995797 [Juglans regia]KAF5454683.1 hypothetical protein F2P56_024330 [Juglans regia]